MKKHRKSILCARCLTAITFRPVLGGRSHPIINFIDIPNVHLSTFHKADKYGASHDWRVLPRLAAVPFGYYKTSILTANIVIFRDLHEKLSYFREILRLTAFLCKDDKLYISAKKIR
jgi:hypothetical protein